MLKSLTLKSIPMKSLRAHLGRTLTILLLVAAQALCVTGALLMVRSSRLEMQLAQERLGADILVYPMQATQRISMDSVLMQGTPVEVWKSRSLLDRMSECAGIEKVSWQIYMKDSTGEHEDDPVWIAGYEPDTDFVLSPWVEEGSSRDLADGQVLAGSEAAAGEDTVTLFGKEWPVAARLAPTGSQMDNMVYVNLITFSELAQAAADAGETKYENISPWDQFSVALLKVSDPDRVQTVTDWLNVYVRKIQAVRGEAELTDTAGSISRQVSLIRWIAVVAWLVLLVALLVVQSFLMRERRKEFAVWRAAGASRRIVRGQMLREALLTHLAGSVGGALLAVILGAAMHGAAAVGNAGYTLGCVAAAVMLSVLTGCIGAAAGAARAQTQKSRISV